MNQQIQHLQDAKEMLIKAREMADQAQALLRRTRGDTGLTMELSRGLSALQQASKRIDVQCGRIERKAARKAMAGVQLETEPDYDLRAIQYLESTLDISDTDGVVG